ncbi:MAG: multiphosphoryl transfer protein [Actinomycetota bacterium]|jgi:dihydroxyacetone kinase phosphotransfer subunit|nr:multiphosphoryl transfer protein [Actinomycetota bacterium]
MIGIVVVSHSSRLAAGVVELAREMGGGVAIEAAGGLEGADALGTSATLIAAAIERVWSGDGVLVLMDLGSAVLSAEAALELLGNDRGEQVVLSDGPLAEGAVIAAVAAAAGSTLAEVADQARRALEPKSRHLDRRSPQPGSSAAVPEAPPSLSEPFCLEGLPAAPGVAYGEARHAGPGGLSGTGILIVADLTPGEAALLDPSQVFGVASAAGAPTSPGAVVARSKGIPAVTGLGEAVLGVPEGMELLIDGEAGLLYGEASREIGAAYRFRVSVLEATATRAHTRAAEPAVTRDGERVEVLALPADPAGLVVIDAGALALDVVGVNPDGHADYLEPAVLGLIGRVVSEASGTPVAVHGDAGGDPAAVPLLVGLGVRQLAVMPDDVARVKESIRGLDAAAASALAAKALTLDSAEDVRRLAAGFLGADAGARRPQMGTRQMPETDGAPDDRSDSVNGTHR